MTETVVSKDSANSLSEIERIREEFTRRADEIPAHFYSRLHLANIFRFEHRRRYLAAMLSDAGFRSLSKRSLLEIGCGSRPWLLEFAFLGVRHSNMAGIDLMEEAISNAGTYLPGADLRVGNAAELPWTDDSFDLVIQSTAFTSILDDSLKRGVANEMQRVLKPDGVILWYDFRYDNPRNPHVRGIEKAEIARLFSDCRIRLRKITLAPPITRRLVNISWIMCELLEKIPFLRTHYLGIITRNKIEAMG